MTLQWQQKRVPFGVTQDEGKHPFALPDPLLQSLRNGRSYKDGYTKKRPGWVQTATLTGSLSQVARCGNQLYTVEPSTLTAAPPRGLHVINQLTTRSDAQAGPASSRTLSEVNVQGRDTIWRDLSQLGSGTGGQVPTYPDHAICGPNTDLFGAGSFRVIAWMGRCDTEQAIYAVVLDAKTNQPVVNTRIISTTGGGSCRNPRVLSWVTDAGVIFERTSTNEIFAVKFDGTTRTWGAPVQQVADLNGNAYWDACSNFGSSRWWLAYRNTTPNLVLQDRTGTGGLTATQIIAENPERAITIYADSFQGKVWFAWQVLAVGLRVAARNAFNLAAVVLAPTTIEGVTDNDTNVTIAPVNTIDTVVVCWTTSGLATIGTIGFGRPLTKCRTVTSAGVLGSQVTRASFEIISKAWQAVNGSVYVNVLYDASGEDSTNVLGMRSDGFTTAFTMCLGHAVDLSAGTIQTTFRPCASWAMGFAGYSRRYSTLSNVTYLKADDGLSEAEYAFTLGSEFDQIVKRSVPLGSVGVDLCRMGINASNFLPVSCATVGQNAVFAGGITSVWDGENLSEYGIFVPPENAKEAIVAAVGHLTAGTYAAAITYEYKHATGDISRSPVAPVWTDVNTPSVAVSNNDYVGVSVPGLSLTAKYNDTSSTLSKTMGVTIKAYRTESDGNIYYQETDPLGTGADNTGSSLNHPFQLIAEASSFAQADSDVLARPFLYTTGGILQSYAMPATSMVVSHAGRLFGILAEDRRQIVFTHTYDPGELPGWHPDLVIVMEDEAVGLAVLDEKLIILCANGVYVLAGTGPDRKGLNSDFAGPDRINGPHGCISPRSILQLPVGIAYRARAGIMILDQKFGITRISGPVEDTLGACPNTICSAVYPEKEWAYWSVYAFDSNTSEYTYRTVAFDWRHNVWSVDDVNAPGELPGDSTPTGMLSFAVHPLGYLYGTNAFDSGLYIHAEYADFIGGVSNGAWIAFYLKTAWMNLGSQQAFQRARWLGVLGERYDAHELDVTISNDYGNTTAQTFNWNNADTEVLLYNHLKMHLAKQRCTAMQVELSVEQASAGDGSADGLPNHAGVGFIGLVFEMGFKSNVDKRPQAGMR